MKTPVQLPCRSNLQIILAVTLLLSITPCLSCRAQPFTWRVIAGTVGSPSTGKTVDGTNSAARFKRPKFVAASNDGRLFVTQSDGAVREIAPMGTNWVVTTITTNLHDPAGVTLDTNGNLLVADFGHYGVVKLHPDGTNWSIQTIMSFNPTSHPDGIAINSEGTVFITDFSEDTLITITPSSTNWIATVVAGNSSGMQSVDGTNTDALFEWPEGLCIDNSGALFTAESASSLLREIQQFGTNWVVSSIAGSYRVCRGIEGTNSDAAFCGPKGIAVDRSGSLYVADQGNRTIRKVTHLGADWVVTSVGPTWGTFYMPWGIAVGPNGDLYVCDNWTQTIWQGQQLIPTLECEVSGDNLILSWPAVAANFILESSTATTNSSWLPVPNQVSTNGANLAVTTQIRGTQSFYRLRKG